MGGDGSNWNNYRAGSLRYREHVAAAIKQRAGLHDETRRENLAGDDGLGLDFDFALRSNDSVEMAGDDDVVAFDFTCDIRVLANDQGFVRDQRTLGSAIDAKRAGRFEAALELNSLFEEPRPFSGILTLAVKPTQSH